MSLEESLIERYADVDGKLFSEDRKLDIFRGSHSLLVPQIVRVESRTSPFDPHAPVTPCLVYDVPAAWANGVSVADAFDLLQSDRWGYERGEVFTSDSWLTHARKGFKGTQGGADPSGLLESFLQLAAPEYDVEKNTEWTLNAVTRFVQRWGPLWLCRNMDHRTFGRRCYWYPGQALHWNGTVAACLWYPAEEVTAFLHEAREAKEVLEAVDELRREYPGLTSAVQAAERAVKQGQSMQAFMEKWGPALARQNALTRRIQTHLAVHGHLTVEIRWLAGMEPQYLLASPLGFLPTVWLEIVQLLCGTKGICRCDGCNNLYAPTRQPKTGQHKFCPRCRQGNHGPAKLAMRRKRAKPLE